MDESKQTIMKRLGLDYQEEMDAIVVEQNAITSIGMTAVGTGSVGSSGVQPDYSWSVSYQRDYDLSPEGQAMSEVQ